MILMITMGLTVMGTKPVRGTLLRTMIIKGAVMMQHLRDSILMG